MKRGVRISRTARELFRTMLAQGVEKFGVEVVDEKRRIVLDTLENYLAEYPHHGLNDRGRKLRHFPVSKTPFVVVYEYDEAELRVLFIIHKRADRSRLDPTLVEW